MAPREITLAHELDAAWIITLWKAIHGGDPGPEIVAAEAIAALSQYLRGAESSFSFAQLEKQFANLGVQVTEHREQVGAQTAEAKPQAVGAEDERIVHQYCFKFKGQTICTELPSLIHRRIAA